MEPTDAGTPNLEPQPAAAPRISAPPALWPALALLAAALLWGGSFAAMRVALRVLNPWSLMWLRMAIGLALLAPFVARRLHRDLRASYRKGDWKLLALLVASEPCLYFLLESNALRFTTSSQAGVIVAAAPLLVALGARMFLGERMSAAGAAGLALSIVGVAGLTLLGGLPRSGAAGAANAPLGNALEMGAMIAAAAYTLSSHRLGRRYPPWSLTALQLAAGALFFLPGLGFLIRDGWPGFPGGASSRQLGFPVDPGGGARLPGQLRHAGGLRLLQLGVEPPAGGRGALFLNLIPVIAVLLGWVLLGESLSAGQCLSAAAVVGGVLLGQGLGRRPGPIPIR